MFARGRRQLRFHPRQRVYFKSLCGERTFRGFVIRPLAHGFYLVDDGTSRPPRVVHGSRLGAPEIKTSGVFA